MIVACPYVGLRPFDAEHADYFFGRTSDSRVLAESVLTRPIVLFYGASGVGKSSVINVGLDKALVELEEEAGLFRVSQWQEPTKWADVLDHFAGISGRPGSQILVLDQFEEYFLYRPRAVTLADAFERGLAAFVARTDIETHLVLSLREDALHHLDAIRLRLPGLFDTRIRLEHLDEKSVREAIERPVEVFNTKVRLPSGRPPVVIELGFTDALLRQLGLGAERTHVELPYLQLALEKLWAKEGGESLVALRRAALEAFGGVDSIVREHVDAVMDDLDDEGDRRLAAVLFRQLATPSGTKIALTTRDLADLTEQPADDIDRVMRRLASSSGRIVRQLPSATGRPEDARYEVFHDSIVSAILSWRSRYRERSARQEAEREIIAQRSAPISSATTFAAAGGVPQAGIALCLSGSGYRGLLFQVGVLHRMAETGLLERVDRICATGAASIAAAFLMACWGRSARGTTPDLKRIMVEVEEAARALTTHNIDVQSVITQLLLPSSQSQLVKRLNSTILHGLRLGELPEHPELMITASNISTGAVWRFSKTRMGDYIIGLERDPNVPLATAVAASANLAPIMTPIKIVPDGEPFNPQMPELAVHARKTGVHLSNGEILDKLALETAWNRYETILVSEGHEASKPTVQDLDASTGMIGQIARLTELLDSNARSLRRRQLVDSLQHGIRAGAYWNMRTTDEAGDAEALHVAPERAAELLAMPIRYSRLDGPVQSRFINLGYACCDMALRRSFDRSLPKALSFPCPGGV